MATFTGTVEKTNYAHYYRDVQSNPGDFVKRVLQDARVGDGPSSAEPSGTFKVGKETFRLTLATRGKTQKLCIKREVEDGKSWLHMRMVGLMDALFFRCSTRTMERALRSEATIKTAMVAVMRPDAQRIVKQLWPDADVQNAEARPGPSTPRSNAASANRRPITERCLETLVPLNPGEIDAWMRCPDGGPVSLDHIDRGKSRIEDGILILSFKSGSDAIEFRLQARPGGTQGGAERVGRDMERLLGIAKGDREDCDYRNMAELMGRFMVATIEDEAPLLLEKAARHIVEENRDNDVLPLLSGKIKADRTLEPNRATRRAIARAVDETMVSCRATAQQRFQAILDGACRDKADTVVSTALDVREKLMETIGQKARAFLAERRLAAFVTQVVRERGVDPGAAMALHNEHAVGSALPERVRLVQYTRKPDWLERLSGEEAGVEVLAVASREDGEALRFVPLGRADMAAWAWKTIKLAKVPKDVESDARALHRTVFDRSLGRFYESEIRPLLDQGMEAFGRGFEFDEGRTGGVERENAKQLLLTLMASVRIGSTTLGYLHRWAGEAAQADHVIPAETGVAADRVIVPAEVGPRAGMVAEHPVSERQAAAYVLRQDLLYAMGSIANVTESDCNKPVTLYSDGKFKSVMQFVTSAGRTESVEPPQWHPVDEGNKKDSEKGKEKGKENGKEKGKEKQEPQPSRNPNPNPNPNPSVAPQTSTTQPSAPPSLNVPPSAASSSASSTVQPPATPRTEVKAPSVNKVPAEKQGATEKPVSAEKPVSPQKPASAEKPEPAEKPVSAEKPVPVEKPVLAETPVSAEKPEPAESRVPADSSVAANNEVAAEDKAPANA